MIDFYDPRFFKLAKSDEGKELWEFLNRPEVIESLKEASRYQRAAVDAVTEEIEQTFGERLIATGKVLQYKRMIGAMIYNILLPRGFEFVRYGVHCVRGTFLITGTLYKEQETGGVEQ